jgi:PleD family two-component response regulator
MCDETLLCYHWLMVEGMRATTGTRRVTGMAKGRESILVLGRSIRLVEGVADLLQVVGYPVEVSSSWAETEYAMHDDIPPDLVVVDLSSGAAEAHALAGQIRSRSHWSSVPILFVSFSGDDRIRDLQQKSRLNGEKHLYFYAHTLLSMDGLLAKIRTCLA